MKSESRLISRSEVRADLVSGTFYSSIDFSGGLKTKGAATTLIFGCYFPGTFFTKVELSLSPSEKDGLLDEHMERQGI